jgi:hypothetical protein
MQSLKILVIVMGIAILVILAIVVFMIAGRVSGVGGGGPAGFGEIELEVPLGCSIASAEGEDDTLVIRLDGLAERGCQQVLVVDLSSGQVVGRVKAVPSP